MLLNLIARSLFFFSLLKEPLAYRYLMAAIAWLNFTGGGKNGHHQEKCQENGKSFFIG